MLYVLLYSFLYGLRLAVLIWYDMDHSHLMHAVPHLQGVPKLGETAMLLVLRPQLLLMQPPTPEQQ